MYNETARNKRDSQRKRVAKFWEDKRKAASAPVSAPSFKCSDCGTGERDQYGLLKCDCIPF